MLFGFKCGYRDWLNLPGLMRRTLGPLSEAALLARTFELLPCFGDTRSRISIRGTLLLPSLAVDG